MAMSDGNISMAMDDHGMVKNGKYLAAGLFKKKLLLAINKEDMQ